MQWLILINNVKNCSSPKGVSKIIEVKEKNKQRNEKNLKLVYNEEEIMADDGSRERERW